MKYGMPIYLLVLLTSISDAGAADALTVTATPQKYAAPPGEAFPVEYVVSWTGAADAYAVAPEAPPSPEWGSSLLLETKRRSSGNRQETVLTVGYVASQAGRYEAPAFTIHVLALDDASAPQVTKLEDSAPAQVVQAPPVQVVFRTSKRVFWVFGAGIVLAGVAAVLVRMKRRPATEGEPTPPPHEQARALLHEARRRRLDGDFYAYYKTLHSALMLVAKADAESLQKTLCMRIDDTGYRGMRPSEDALDGDFKDVERIIAQEAQRMSKET